MRYICICQQGGWHMANPWEMLGLSVLDSGTLSQHFSVTNTKRQRTHLQAGVVVQRDGLGWDVRERGKLKTTDTEILVMVTDPHWGETRIFIHSSYAFAKIENYQIIFHQYHLLVLAQSVQESFWHLWFSTGPKLSPWRHLVWSRRNLFSQGGASRI